MGLKGYYSWGKSPLIICKINLIVNNNNIQKYIQINSPENNFFTIFLFFYAKTRKIKEQPFI